MGTTTYQLDIPSYKHSETGVSSDGSATFKVVTDVETHIEGANTVATITQKMYISRTKYTSSNQNGYGYINTYFGNNQIHSYSFSQYNNSISPNSGDTVAVSNTWTYIYSSSESKTINVQASFKCNNQFLYFTLPDSGSYSDERVTSGTPNIVLPRLLNVTPCSPPNNISISQNNGTCTIGWSDAQGGVSNTIVGYNIQYRTSANSPWINLKSINTTSSSGSTTTGILNVTTGYYQVQIQTKGTAGINYYSTYQMSLALASATPCIQPTFVDLFQNNGFLRISWGGSSNGTSNNIIGYEILYRTSANSEYELLDYLSTTATGGGRIVDVTDVDTGYYQVQIRTNGSQGTNYYSPYTVSEPLAIATSCTAPIIFTISPTLTTGDVSLSWMGETGGISNDISGYDIQYRTSRNRTTWSDWTELVNTSNNYYNYTSSETDGVYIQYKVRTQGTQGSNYYSDYKVSSYYVKMNTPPATVSSVSVNKLKYNQGDSITLSWQQPTDIDSNISSYEIYYLLEGEDPVYFANTIDTSYTFIPTQAQDGQRVQYGVKTFDTLGATTGVIRYSTFITRDDSTGIKVCIDGEYRKAYLYVCIDGEYKLANIYVCDDNEEYISASD